MGKKVGASRLQKNSTARASEEESRQGAARIPKAIAELQWSTGKDMEKLARVLQSMTHARRSEAGLLPTEVKRNEAVRQAFRAVQVGQRLRQIPVAAVIT